MIIVNNGEVNRWTCEGVNRSKAPICYGALGKGNLTGLQEIVNEMKENLA